MNEEHILNRKRIDDKLMIETFGEKTIWLEGFSFVKMTKTSHKFIFVGILQNRNLTLHQITGRNHGLLQ